MSSGEMSVEEIQRQQEEQCIFCKIVKGEIPSNKVFDDKDHLVILDINPANEGHLIILPKKHYQIMPQVPENELSNMFVLSKKVSKALLQTYQSGGTSVFVANGGVAGQRAPHFMIHVIPRKKNDLLFKIPKKEVDSIKLKQIQQTLILHLSKMFGRKVVSENIPQKQEEDVDLEKLSSELPTGDNNDLDNISNFMLGGK